MMRNNYRYSRGVARLVPEQRRPVSLCVERRGLRRQRRVSRGARVRGAAQRLRLLEIPVRSACPQDAARSAPRRSPVSAISTSTARASSTRDAARRSRCTSASSIASEGRVRAVRRLGRLRRRRAAPRFRRGGGRRQGQPRFSRSSRAQRHLQSRQRTRRDVQFGRRRRRSTRAAPRPERRRDRSRELVADGVIRYIPLPPALAGKYQSFTEADLTRLRAAGYVAPMQTIDEGVPRYVERLISGARPPRSLGTRRNVAHAARHPNRRASPNSRWRQS